jgi:hypothetical protein
MSARQSDRSDATIRPIARPRSESAAPAVASGSRSKLLGIAAIAALLLVGLLTVFVLLPGEREADAQHRLKSLTRRPRRRSVKTSAADSTRCRSAIWPHC